MSNATVASANLAGFITTLKPNQCIVFGSNPSGFHGAGLAGYAYTGKTGNQYREGNLMLKAPNGTVGKWAVKGVGVGFQRGSEGMSYAIPTVARPGFAISQELFFKYLCDFAEYSKLNPDIEFLFTEIGKLRCEGGHSFLGVEKVKSFLRMLKFDGNVRFLGCYSEFNENKKKLIKVD